MVEPHGRSPVLADALKRIGLAECSGRGVDRVFEGSWMYGRALPDYSESSATNVKLFIPRSLPDTKFIRMVSEEQRHTGSLMPFNTRMILNTLKRGRCMSIHDIADETKISEGKIWATVERMTGSGLSETVGNGKGRAYILSTNAYQDKVSYVRQTDIEAICYQELILKLAEAKQSISRKDVVELLHVGSQHVYRIIQKMVKEGMLIQERTTRDIHYRTK